MPSAASAVHGRARSLRTAHWSRKPVPCQSHAGWEVGFDAITTGAIAARAYVGWQTIYRWWPSMGAVVFEAFPDKVNAGLFPEGNREGASSCGSTPDPTGHRRRHRARPPLRPAALPSTHLAGTRRRSGRRHLRRFLAALTGHHRWRRDLRGPSSGRQVSAGADAAPIADRFVGAASGADRGE